MMHREKGSVVWSLVLSCVSVISFTKGIFLLTESSSKLVELNILSSSSCSLQFTFYLDWISCLFFSFVAFISCFVIYYSGSYMGGDKNIERFLSLVMMFVLSMFLLVFSLNLVSILLGWDGLGIVSYVLVIYYQNEKSNAAGMITALSNRVGDVAILLSIGAMVEYGSWGFVGLPLASKESSFMIMVLLVIAAMTKSAQMPFSAWLPAAMAAPTPVSALVHSSTLVTAGVYLLIRFNPLLIHWGIGVYLFFIGCLTTLMASVSANFETDLKKVVALSTLSQLGIMMSTLSLGLEVLAFFHLLTHAMFKALLFLCSGKVIHESLETQDTRAMGSLLISLPYTSTCMNLSNLALCGFPFLAGFYSKDLLVEKSLMMDQGSVSLLFLSLSVGLSASYSIRLSFVSMLNATSLPPLSSSKEEDAYMFIPKLALGSMAVISGCALAWMIFPDSPVIILPPGAKLMALYSTFVGVILGLILSFSEKMAEGILEKSKAFNFLIQMWFLPWLSGGSLGNKGVSSGSKLKSMEYGWWEFLSGQGARNLIARSSFSISVWQNNMVKFFLLIFLSGSVLS
nr:NADH dehydrogenase subunit 5 [Isocladus armatus]